MGCILYPPESLVSRLHRLQQRRRPTRATQQPVCHLTPPCVSTTHASTWRWRAFLSELSQKVNTAYTLPTPALQASPASRTTDPAPRATRTATTATPTTPTTTNETGKHLHKAYHRRKNKPVVKRKDKKMEHQFIALPSIALCVSVLALSAAIGCSSSSSNAPASGGTLSSALGRGASLGLGLNLSTIAPLLTLAWHVLSLLSPRPRPTHSRRLSAFPPAPLPLAEDTLPSTTTRTRTTRIWAPHTLALVWALHTLLLLAVPRWTADSAFSYAGLAVLSTLEAGVLALAGGLAHHRIQRELAGDTDDERGWECDDDADDDDDADVYDTLKLTEI